ncbi:MAG TPA: DUF2946 family protein [Burkholderiales bacterium]|nr:DUF2946 family protein [Burkholderiales bacterium]
MDEIVLRGMAKWPNVPAVYGWLGLNRRGQWLIKGERIPHPLVTEFIGRNYARDERGCWYFQNGPQRVFVNLDYAPFVLRTVNREGDPLELRTHNEKPVARVGGVWVDESGVLIVESEHGAGTIHDRDLERLVPSLLDAKARPVDETELDQLMETLQRGQAAALWLNVGGSKLRIEPIASGDVPKRFRFVAQPEPPAGEEVCR